MTIVPGETLDDGIIHVAPSEPRQPKPACKMLCVRPISALGATAVSHGSEMMSVEGEMRDGMFKIIKDGNIATVLEEANEATHTTDVRGVAKLPRTIAGAVTPMPCKAPNSSDVHAGQGNAAPIKPKQKVTRRAGVVPHR